MLLIGMMGRCTDNGQTNFNKSRWIPVEQSGVRLKFS